MTQKILFERKILPIDVLKLHLTQAVRPAVFTNGCFDILHRGHVTYLAQANALGNSLIVALNTDDSLKRQGKGEGRPVNSLPNRMAVIAALESVDFVTWFDDDTPLHLIEYLQPEILVKGGDWPIEKIVGSHEMLARGGKVYSIPFIYDISTTQIINQIKQVDILHN